jgi:phospholipid/cholesterol/gamma-HCH transport system permease protein
MSTAPNSPRDTPDNPASGADAACPPAPVRLVAGIGAWTLEQLRTVGDVTWLGFDTLRWIWRALVLRKVRFGRHAVDAQICRIGVQSIPVVMLVSTSIGLILALQMAPPLDELGFVSRVADVIGIGVFRELGPVLAAIVLTGFAGAAIAAELGTMVVGEEVEALEAHALNPVRFLVVPRVIATAIALVTLTVLADLSAVIAGWAIGVTVLGIPSGEYVQLTLDQLAPIDFLTGLIKALVFGVLLGLIACRNGLAVRGGAAGVGKATTDTVVASIVMIIQVDLIFTAIFYALGWF